MNVSGIRKQFKQLLKSKDFVTDKTGVQTLEIVGASFIADEETVFGEVNWDYVNREIAWYESQSLNVNDIPGVTPAIWTQVADTEGFINSNYGWCVYSKENGEQYKRVLQELTDKEGSRRAVMIYTRPSMWDDYDKNGRSDFMCTNTVQFLVRHGKLDCVVQMRSNDLIFGYKNDRAWHDHILQQLSGDIDIPAGKIYWQVGSLHVYSRHFNLIK